MAIDPTRTRRALALLLSVSTTAHVARPQAFLPMIPRWVPGGRARVHTAATALEGLTAALLWRARTGRTGGLLAIAVFAGVFPANVEAVRVGGYHAAPGWLGSRTAAVLRLPLQLPLVWWAEQVRRGRGVGRP